MGRVDLYWGGGENALDPRRAVAKATDQGVGLMGGQTAWYTGSRCFRPCVQRHWTTSSTQPSIEHSCRASALNRTNYPLRSQYAHAIILNQSFTANLSLSTSSSSIEQQCAIGPLSTLRLVITRRTAFWLLKIVPNKSQLSVIITDSCPKVV